MLTGAPLAVTPKNFGRPQEPPVLHLLNSSALQHLDAFDVNLVAVNVTGYGNMMTVVLF